MDDFDALASQQRFAQILLHLLIETLKLRHQLVSLVPVANWVRHPELLQKNVVNTGVARVVGTYNLFRDGS